MELPALLLALGKGQLSFLKLVLKVPVRCILHFDCLSHLSYFRTHVRFDLLDLVCVSLGTLLPRLAVYLLRALVLSEGQL